MITKLVVKDFVSKRCPYLTKCELEDKTLIELLKKALKSNNSYKDILSMDKEENVFENDDGNEEAFNIANVLKEHPDFKKLVIEYQNKQKKNKVEELIEQYSDEDVISNLVRRYFINMYGANNCKECDIDDKGNPIFDQRIIFENTKQALKDSNIRVIFEGQIEIDDLRARFDVLIKNDDGTFTLLEAKATNSVCTHTKGKEYIDNKIKDQYLYDLAFQHYVYRNYGLNLSSIGYITLNKNYSLSNASYPVADDELCKFFVIKTSLNLKTGEMPIIDYFDNYEYSKLSRNPQEAIDVIINQIRDIDKNLQENPKKCYFCRKGPICPFINHCFADAFDCDSIFKLSNWGLFGGNYLRVKEALDSGYDKISSLPDSIVNEYDPIKKNGKISNARTQINMEKGEIIAKYLLDRDEMGNILKEYIDDSIDYLIFFDFESFQNPIPLVKDSTPYNQVVSQYSMHIVSKDYDLTKHDFEKGIGGGITHKEFIGNPDKDCYDNPSIELYKTLYHQLKECGIDPLSKNYRVIVFNQNFEKTRMNEFAEAFATKCDSNLISFVNQFNDNVIDLLDFFTNGAIYSRDFMGRGSLKIVQPSLTSDENVLAYYKSLNLPFDFSDSLDYKKGNTCLVYNGEICLDLYKSLLIRHHKGITNDGLNTENLLKEALAYCKIDSWGTVIIFDIIKNVYLNKINLDSKDV